jgi:16S rRNA (guanine527-N7)-methyltransferase
MSHEEIPPLVEEAAAALPAAMRPADLEPLLCGYLALLLDRNREVNLVSRRDTLQHLARFTRECLFLARILHEERARLRQQERAPRLLDIGSGAGFPGMVLKIALPDLDVHLVEGTRKKARFLADTAAGLDLRGIRVVWARAEELVRVEKEAGARELRQRMDWVTGKGLGSLRDSAALAEPFLVEGGVHWTFKGKACSAEVESASGFFRQRGFAVHRVEPIPGSEESYVVGVERLGGSGGRTSRRLSAAG